MAHEKIYPSKARTVRTRTACKLVAARGPAARASRVQRACRPATAARRQCAGANDAKSHENKRAARRAPRGVPMGARRQDRGRDCARDCELDYQLRARDWINE